MLDQLESGPWPSFVSDLKQQAEKRAKNAEGIEFQVPRRCRRRPSWAFSNSLQTRPDPLETRRNRRRFRLRRRRHRPLLRPARRVSRVWPISTPCASTSPAANSTPPITCVKALRSVGFARQRHHQHARLHRRHHLSRHHHPQLEEIFFELTHNHQPGSGRLRLQPADPGRLHRPGPLRIRLLRYQDLCYDLTQEYQDELHRPAFPYKFKFKFDGCPNCCVASIARSDLSFIGTWKDDIKIDQEAVQAYIGGEFKPNAGAHSGRDWGKFDIQKEVIGLCPTECMWMDGKTLKIDNKECTRCMHCINVMPRALRIGDDRGVSILAGAKAPILDGAQMGTLVVPFIEVPKPPTPKSRKPLSNPVGLVDGRRQKPRAYGRIDETPGPAESDRSPRRRSRSAHGAGTAFQPLHLLEGRRGRRRLRARHQRIQKTPQR
jgi:dissimilatory sulfite reductase alpha subunit